MADFCTLNNESKNWVRKDKQALRSKWANIQAALSGATGMMTSPLDSKEDVFYMLLFCLCVPQSKAILAEQAMDKLRQRDYYHRPIPLRTMKLLLKGLVRFHNTKAKRLHSARRSFPRIWRLLKSSKDSVFLREELVRSVDGMGLKLASHFLRNIGIRDLAIIDVHVLDCMKARNLIPRNDFSLTKSRYYDIERVMKAYAERCGVGLQELDLFFWSEKTGFVFK